MSLILPKRIITTSRKEQISQYQSDEEDISISLNMISIDAELMKRDDYEFVDDYTCFESKEINPACMKTSTEVSPETEERVHEIMTNNKESFATKPDQPGCCKGATYEIETTSEVPVHSVPHRKPPTIDEDLFFRDTISDTYEGAYHKKRIIGETPESKIFNTKAEGCRYIDYQCKLYNFIVVWKNNSNANLCQLTKNNKNTIIK